MYSVGKIQSKQILKQVVNIITTVFQRVNLLPVTISGKTRVSKAMQPVLRVFSRDEPECNCIWRRRDILRFFLRFILVKHEKLQPPSWKTKLGFETWERIAQYGYPVALDSVPTEEIRLTEQFAEILN
jgi:hypothetical protein